MRKLSRLLGMAAVAATVSLAGCAPGFGFAGMSPSFEFRGACTPMQRQSLHRPSVFVAKQQVAAVQARAMLGARSGAPTPGSGTRIASGECRR